MDWKTVLKRKGEEAAGKILPMDSTTTPRLGTKARIAGVLAGIATVLTIISQYLSN